MSILSGFGLILLFPLTAFPQVNFSGINYQAVVRDAGGDPIPGQAIGVQVGIVVGGVDDYWETHAVTTNDLGLIVFQIGTGTPAGGSIATFDAIPWAGGDDITYQVNVDVTGGTSYVPFSNGPFLSVPFALHARTADGLVGLADADGDTRVMVERTPDEDTIRFEMGGVEHFSMADGKLFVANSGGSVFMGENAGANDNLTNNRNVAVGAEAFSSATNSVENVAVGHRALATQAGGSGNTATGVFALEDLTNGASNTANGHSALRASTTGDNNVAVGYYALRNNTEATGNVAVGAHAGRTNTTAGGMTAVGYQSLYNSTGENNTAVGFVSSVFTTTGHDNTAVGARSLNFNTTGSNNVAVGDSAAYGNTSGYGNVAVGSGALKLHTASVHNVAVGFQSLRNATGASLYNTCVGSWAGRGLTSGSYNTGVGTGALQNVTTGSYNTGIGRGALEDNGSASYNTAVGYRSGWQNNQGGYNASLGYRSLYNNTGGQYNVAIGANSNYASVLSERNTTVGYASGESITTGADNVLLGYNAGQNVTNGPGNVIIGSGAASQNNSTVGKNVVIGFNALPVDEISDWTVAIGTNTMPNFGASGGVGDDNIAIGRNALFGSSIGASSVMIGREASNDLPVSPFGYVDGCTGIGAFTNTGNVNATAIGQGATAGDHSVVLGNSLVSSIGGYAGWSNLSDGQFKRNVQEDVPGLAFIKLLRPVTYQLDIDELNRSLGAEEYSADSPWQREYEKQKADMIAYQRTGFIAQEVEAAAESIGYDFSGIDRPQNESDHYGLRYAEFVVPLVKAMQEQQEMIERLQVEIEEMRRLVR
ncbi:MAG: tail fiber domain-containing protein [Flavobacteriales bacterium]|nr:tail fiber domain-containing protein [Flavobacteriales bacterium]